MATWTGCQLRFRTRVGRSRTATLMRENLLRTTWLDTRRNDALSARPQAAMGRLYYRNQETMRRPSGWSLKQDGSPENALLPASPSPRPDWRGERVNDFVRVWVTSPQPHRKRFELSKIGSPTHARLRGAGRAWGSDLGSGPRSIHRRFYAVVPGLSPGDEGACAQ